MHLELHANSNQRTVLRDVVGKVTVLALHAHRAVTCEGVVFGVEAVAETAIDIALELGAASAGESNCGDVNMTGEV